MNSPFVPPEPTGPESNDPPSDDVRAAEFVVGVLDAAERRQVQARIESDQAFAARVAYWERRFAPLLDEIEPVEAPAQVWSAVCRRLGWREGQSTEAGFWHSLRFWRAATALAGMVAVAAIGFLVSRPPTLVTMTVPIPVVRQQLVEPAARPVMPLTHDDGTPAWLASVDPVRHTVLMVPVPAAPDAQGRVPELWLIPAGKAPISLGAVSVTESHTVTVPANAQAALVAGSTLAITLEQAAGIPHAAPTTPVIAKGTIQPGAAT